MSAKLIIERLDARQQVIITSVKRHAESLLNHSPRFKFFTLHGTNHLNNLFEILEILIKGGINLNQEELFLISSAICVHDLGMVIGLGEREIPAILEGKPVAPDPAAIELYIRETHHELVEKYLEQNASFLLSLGLSAAQLGQVADISKCHRKVILTKQVGVVQYLGALLRVIDELDLGNNRAPSEVFLNLHEQMDSTSVWHWFKHNITEPWLLGHTVSFLTENRQKKIQFFIVVRPTKENSIAYWLHQIQRPIRKALDDDGAGRIIFERFGVQIECIPSRAKSKASSLDKRWEAIEDTALYSGRKVVLVVDDEFRKLDDLFLPVMDHYYVQAVYNAKDALIRLEATRVDLVIVDMQIGSGGIWNEKQTNDFKTTGINICETIRERFPHVKVGILTGTKHPVPPAKAAKADFFLRKPVDPDKLLQEINYVLK
jgi:CheY-like chemotaxis protein